MMYQTQHKAAVAAADSLETIHLYLVPEEEERSVNWPKLIAILTRGLTMLFAVGLLSWGLLLPENPVYDTHTITVPLLPLPVQTLYASAVLIPTGSITDPAIQSTGTLTLYNGSVLVQSLPANFLVTSAQGREIETDEAVVIPAAHLPQIGLVSVPAHAVQAGIQGNIAPLAIDQTYGSALVIKNLGAFAGGKESQTLRIVTAHDRQEAVQAARDQLNTQKPAGIQRAPCQERVQQEVKQVVVTWTCQFFTYQVPAHLHILSVQIRQVDVLLVTREIVSQS